MGQGGIGYKLALLSHLHIHISAGEMRVDEPHGLGSNPGTAIYYLTLAREPLCHSFQIFTNNNNTHIGLRCC